MFQPFLAATCQTLRPLSASGIPCFNSNPHFLFLYFCIAWYLVKLNNFITTCKNFISIWVWVCLTDYKCYGMEWLSEHKNSKMIWHIIKREQICKCVYKIYISYNEIYVWVREWVCKYISTLWNSVCSVSQVSSVLTFGGSIRTHQKRKRVYCINLD